MKSMFQIIGLGSFLFLFTIIISGCMDKVENIPDIDQETTPFSTPAKPDASVPPAPKQLFLFPNSSESFQFWSHNMTVSYLSSFPHLVEVTIDGDIETIEINRSTQCPGSNCGYYVTKNDIGYSIQPVIWRYNEAGEKIWYFETWNTSELYFEAHFKGTEIRPGEKKL